LVPAAVVACVAWSFTAGAFPISKGGTFRCVIVPGLIAFLVSFVLLWIFPDSRGTVAPDRNSKRAKSTPVIEVRAEELTKRKEAGS